MGLVPAKDALFPIRAMARIGKSEHSYLQKSEQCYLPKSEQCYFPVTKDANGEWRNSHIINGVHYKLIVNDAGVVRHKYEIKVEGAQPIGLQIKGKNEMKLKWIHGMYWIQKEPLAFVTIILAALTLLATIIFGIIGLRHK